MVPRNPLGTKWDGAPGTTRTYDLWLRKPTLYPTELRVRFCIISRACHR